MFQSCTNSTTIQTRDRIALSSSSIEESAAQNGSNSLRVLIVSSSEQTQMDLTALFDRQLGVTSGTASSGSQALERLEHETCDIVVLDSSLPDLDSSELHSLVNAEFPRTQVLILGRNIDRTSTDPRILAISDLLNDSELFLADLPEPSPAEPPSFETRAVPKSVLPGMIGTSEAMERVYFMTSLVARRDTTVLISGASGTGKELVAHAIHHLSSRRAGPFVIINCAAIPETLLEAELFGYVKGAFTGAMQSRSGRIHAAQGGTLFLDEIGELPLALQAKLLRFLEQGEVQRLGSSETFRADVRVVAATNVNLRRSVEDHKFREDLYYRLAVFPIGLPTLKDRIDDVQSLANHFVTVLAPHPTSVSQDAMTLLQGHDWPGNVRELRNVIERAVILACDSPIITSKHIVL